MDCPHSESNLQLPDKAPSVIAHLVKSDTRTDKTNLILRIFN